jgi:malate dehydrogenase (oxaloacetate-decarboxylating)(NADP+)
MFGVEPVIAMVIRIGSSSSPKVSKVEAVAYLHEHHPDLIIDGEVQADSH